MKRAVLRVLGSAAASRVCVRVWQALALTHMQPESWLQARAGSLQGSRRTSTLDVSISRHAGSSARTAATIAAMARATATREGEKVRQDMTRRVRECCFLLSCRHEGGARREVRKYPTLHDERDIDRDSTHE